MPVITYNICTVDKFSAVPAYTLPLQSKLDGFEENPTSSYELLDDAWINDQSRNIKLYKAHQDLIHNRYGFVFGREFYSYLEPNDFKIFFEQSRRIALLNTGKATVSAFVECMSRDPDAQMQMERLNVDLKQVITLIPIVRGAWFSDIDKQFLSAAGFFGTHVDQSDEFKAAAIAGNIKMVNFSYEFRGQELSLAITKSGGVILHNRLGDTKLKKYDELSEVELVIELYDKLLKPRS